MEKNSFYINFCWSVTQWSQSLLTFQLLRITFLKAGLQANVLGYHTSFIVISIHSQPNSLMMLLWGRIAFWNTPGPIEKKSELRIYNGLQPRLSRLGVCHLERSSSPKSANNFDGGRQLALTCLDTASYLLKRCIFPSHSQFCGCGCCFSIALSCALEAMKHTPTTVVLHSCNKT